MYVRSEGKTDTDVGEHVLGELVLDGGNHGGLDVCLVDDEAINRRTNALFEDCPQNKTCGLCHVTLVRQLSVTDIKLFMALVQTKAWKAS